MERVVREGEAVLRPEIPQALDIGGAVRAVAYQEKTEVPVAQDRDVTLRIALSERREAGDADLERADDLGRRIAIPTAGGERATGREMPEVVGHRLLRVEVALGQRVRAARKRSEAVDHRHHHEAVAVRGPAPEASRLLPDRTHAPIEV